MFSIWMACGQVVSIPPRMSVEKNTTRRASDSKEWAKTIHHHHHATKAFSSRQSNSKCHTSDDGFVDFFSFFCSDDGKATVAIAIAIDWEHHANDTLSTESTNADRILDQSRFSEVLDSKCAIDSGSHCMHWALYATTVVWERERVGQSVRISHDTEYTLSELGHAPDA